MCFSAEADFVSGAVIGAIGVATLTQVERPRELPLAVAAARVRAPPDRRGLRVARPRLGRRRTRPGSPSYLYLAFAWVVLPVLVPVAIMHARDRPAATPAAASWVPCVIPVPVAIAVPASVAARSSTATCRPTAVRTRRAVRRRGSLRRRRHRALHRRRRAGRRSARA